MAAKGWIIGCGALIVIGVLILVLGGGFVAHRLREAQQGMDDARDRYAQTDRDFQFTPPSSGEFTEDRFAQYLRVRSAVQSAMGSEQNLRGFQALLTLTTLPEEVSRSQSEALRKESMSLNEYVWISRQMYTAVAAEAYRDDGDPAMRNLQRDFDAAVSARGGVRTRVGRPGENRQVSGSNAGLLDYTWLRVPDSTRRAVRAHNAELAATAYAVLADSFLVNSDFEIRRPR